MFDILNQAMMFLLNTIHSVIGSYGWSIVVVTVMIRMALWPLNTAQTRSMRKMQELQPKIKALQEKYKDDPQKLQQELFQFYSENKFNPMSGCLPMVIQLPIFIALYGALSSPQFMVQAGQEQFLFVERLHHTLRSNGGEPLDGVFHIDQEDQFQTGKHISIQLKSGATLEKTIEDPASTLGLRPQPAIPGEPIELSINFELLGLSSDYVDKIQSATLPVVDMSSREVENLSFTTRGPWLVKQVDTAPAEKTFHIDVLIMILIYGALSVFYQKLMQQKKAATPGVKDAQADMMKFLPFVFLIVLFFIPIPAGVFLYLLSTMVLMVVQTLVVNLLDKRKEDANTSNKPGSQVIDVKPNV